MCHVCQHSPWTVSAVQHHLSTYKYRLHHFQCEHNYCRPVHLTDCYSQLCTFNSQTMAEVVGTFQQCQIPPARAHAAAFQLLGLVARNWYMAQVLASIWHAAHTTLIIHTILSTLLQLQPLRSCYNSPAGCQPVVATDHRYLLMSASIWAGVVEEPYLHAKKSVAL